MTRTLINMDSGGLLSVMRQIEESRLRTVCDRHRGKTDRIKEAQGIAERARKHLILNIGGQLAEAAGNSGLRFAQSSGERLRKVKTFGGAVPGREEIRREIEQMNQLPAQKVWREMREICERVERENVEKESRQFVQEIIRSHRREMAKSFVSRPLPDFKPEPIKIKMEINVFIIPKNQSTDDGGNPSETN